MGLLNPHLDDAELAGVWTERQAQGGSTSTRPAERHLQGCAECRTRYSGFVGWLEQLRVDARAEADEALGSERLVAQQAQILRRLEALEQPARVLAFPRFAQPVSRRAHSGHWIGAAAAAGLVVGLGLGQWFNLSGTPTAVPIDASPGQIARGALDARLGVHPVTLSDEAFFYDQELVPSQVTVPESLQYLNAITPSARDYDPR